MAAAWICLIAVAFLYAPLAGAALIAHGMDCCVGGYCPVREHHHHKQASAPKGPTDCGHEMSGMKACSMSCCQDHGRPAVVPGAFVLPPAIFVPAAGEMIRPMQFANSQEISRLAKPLSPPPRFAFSVL